MTRRNNRLLTCRLGAFSKVTVAHSLIPVKPFHTLSNIAANVLMGPLADIPGIRKENYRFNCSSAASERELTVSFYLRHRLSKATSTCATQGTEINFN